MAKRVRVTAEQMDSQSDATWGDWEAYALEDTAGVENALLDLYHRKLDSPNTGENDLQSFLERYPWLVPAPFIMHHGITHHAVISKFRPSTAMTTDFVFLTKHSLITRIVLIELESPDATLLTSSNGCIRHTAKVTSGLCLSQLEEWRIYIERHKNAIAESLEPFIYTDAIEFKYALVIGRSAEAHRTFERRQYLASLLQGRPDTDILSYDSLSRAFQLHRREPKNILSQQKNSWIFKSLILPHTSAIPYSQRRDEYVIDLTDEQRELLKKFGFDPAGTVGKISPSETAARRYADYQLVEQLKEDGSI